MSVSLELKHALTEQPIDLPVFHPVALNIILLNSDPYSDIEDIIREINEDQALVAQVLRMANSSAYMGLVKAKTIKEAVIRLGARQITSLAMAASQVSLHSSSNANINGLMQGLWQHSLACALGSWWLARHTGHQSIVEYAYLAGLLHDIGKLYLLKAMENISKDNNNHFAFERGTIVEILTEMHVDQGCRIMDHWNIPQIYRSIVANHHAEHFDPVDSLLAIVRLVNYYSRKVNLSLNPDQLQLANVLTEIELLDMDEAQCNKLEAVMAGYHEIAC